MAGIKLEAFEGLEPRTSDRLKRGMRATIATNTKLLNGEIRGFRAPREEANFTGEYFTVRRAFRVPDLDGTYADNWLLFDNQNVDVIRSPLKNDAYDRYYFAGGGERPQMTTYHRIINNLDPYYLGVPTPPVAPGVTPPAGTEVTRAYVYTYVSEFGEEGPPSAPTLAQGAESGTWSLSSLSTTVPDSSNRSITRKRIYRTVPTENSALFFFVAEIDIGDTSYNDTDDDETVAANNILESETWVEPPSDLEGIVSMPNGYLVGWAGRRLVFSEPYRPHAWPAEYELATEFPIVGCVVWGTTLVIGTQSNPYFGYGVNPASFTLEKDDAVEPCLSKRGMVATVAGAYYPSLNGLVLANGGGAQVITQDILTREEWANYQPENLFAAQLGLQYIAFRDQSNGILFNPTEQRAKFVELQGFSNINGIETDAYDGQVLLLRDDYAFKWDPNTSERLPWQWQSKVYQTPKPLNFGAVRIQFDADDLDVEDDVLAYYGAYNTELIAADVPLNTLNGRTLGGVNIAGTDVNSDYQGDGNVPGWTEPEIQASLGGDLLYDISLQSIQASVVRFIAYAWDKTTGRRRVVSKNVYNEEMIRLPTGFKSDLWQFEMQGNTTVYSVQIAETPKGLADI